MSRLAYLELTDKLRCQGSVAVYGVLRVDQLQSCRDVLAVDDTESLTFSFPKLDETGAERDFGALLRAGRVITAVYDDDSFDEWRVGPVERGRGKDGVISVQCVSLWLDAVERSDSAGGKGWVSEVSAGRRIFDYSLAQRTPASILATYVIPNLPTWITLGTVDPTFVIPVLDVTRMTPGAVVLAVRDALRAVDIPCEVRLRRNGTTDYKLDLVTQIGAGANVPVFHPANSLVSLVERTDPTQQANRILTTGGTNPDGEPGIWGGARWRGGAPSGTTIALTDRNGGASPIGFDGQFVGNYLLRVKTGRTFLITASDATLGTVTLASVSTIAADEDFEFRRDEPLTNTRRLGAQDGLYHVRPYAISGVAGAVLTLVDNFGVLVADPVQVTDDHVDWYARRMTLVRATTANGNFSGGVLTNVTSTVGVLAGDIVFLGITGTPPYGFAFNNGALVVDSTTANTITVHARDDAALGVFASTAVSIRVYRPVATLQRITASNAGSNTITVDAAGTAASTDIIEFVQVDGAGETPCFVDHPTSVLPDPAGYGVKVMELTKKGLGVTQIAPNGWLRTWTNGANPPDGWTKTGAGTLSRSSSITRFGGYSARLQGACTLQSPPIYPVWDPGHAAVSIRSACQAATFSGDLLLTLAVIALNASGGSAATLASVTVTPINSTLTSTKVNVGAWFEMAMKGLSLNTDSTPYGIALVITSPVGGDVYLDLVEVYPFSDCPNDYTEFGDAPALLQATNNKLREVASPPLYYTFTVRDLARLFGAEYARLALTLGGDVRAADIEDGHDVTVRLLRIERDHLAPEGTILTLANRPTRVLTVLAQSNRRQSRVVTYLQQSAQSMATTSYVPLTASTSVPTNAELVTAAASAPTVLLADDSSVSYLPADPTTAPVKTVTVGVPPSRLRALPLIA